MKERICAAAFFLTLSSAGIHAQSPMAGDIDRRAQQVADKVVAWRRDLHQHPELGNRETRTAKVTAAEDFSFFAQRAPGLFVFLGATRKGVDPVTAPANHSPLFDVDEGVLPLGVRTLANLAADFLSQK